MADSMQTSRPIPWFTIEEYAEQIRERLGVLSRDADHLSRVLSMSPDWLRGTLAHEMMKRALDEAQIIADKLSLRAEGTLELLLHASNERSMHHLEILARKHKTVTSLAARLSAYREVVHQRATLADTWDWTINSEQTNELIELQDFYTAIDAVILDFLEQINGGAWIEHQERHARPWLPLVVLGHDYAIRPDTLVTFVPRADLFRARMWPALAHELAHLKVTRLFGEKGLFFPHEHIASPYPGGKKMLNKVAKDHGPELQLLGIDPATDNLEDVRNLLEDLATVVFEAHEETLVGELFKGMDKAVWWPSQVSEFLCDAIGLHVTGPAGVLALMALQYPVPPEKPQTINYDLAARLHPPKLIRIWVMQEILIKRRGFQDLMAETGVSDYIDSALDMAPVEWQKAIEIWSRRVSRIAGTAAELAEAILPPETRDNPIDFQSVQLLRLALEDGDSEVLESVTPCKIVNIPWLKRIIVKKLVVSESDALRWVAFDPVPRIFAAVVGQLNSYAANRWIQIRANTVENDS